MNASRLLGLTLVLFLFTVLLRAAEPVFLDERLPESPKLIRGTLANGMRYGICRQPYPAGQVCLRLVINVGSFVERDNEQGYAHFIEHMGFNGTQNFRSGQAIRYLQAQGVSFGSHFNADTSIMNTVYKLDLPHTKGDLLDRGLCMLSDFAGGMLFEAVEVNKERGVILSEALSRQTNERAEHIAREAFLLQGTRIPQRLPIGTADCVKAATPESLRAFYDAWYRPENMAIVAVGDVSAESLLPQLEHYFGAIQPRGEARTRPEMGTLVPVEEPKFLVWERTAQGLNITFASVYPRPRFAPEQRTWRRTFDRLKLNLANKMLSGRLERICSRPGRLISDSRVMDQTIYDSFYLVYTGVSCSIRNMKDGVAVAEQELRRAMELGFDEQELNFQKERFRANLTEAARMIATLPSNRLVGDMVESFVDPQLSSYLPDEVLEKLIQIVNAITVDDCQQALKKAFSHGELKVMAMIPKGSKITQEQVSQAFEESRKKPVEKAAAFEEVNFAYTDFGAPGQILSKTPIEGLDALKVTFANGLVVFLKHTEFVRGEIATGLRIGGGRLAEPAKHPGLGLYAGELVLGGLGKHSAEELLRLAPSGKFGGSASAEDDSLLLRGTCSRENLRKQLCMMTAFIKDPAFRPDAHEKMIANLNGFLNSLTQSPDAVNRSIFTTYLSGGDKRVAIPHIRELRDVKHPDLVVWLKQQVTTGPMELAMVGDFDLEEAIKMLAETLGTLPPCHPAPEYNRCLNFPEPGKTIKGTYAAVKPRPTTLLFYWPVRDRMDITLKTQVRLLSMILSDRLREQVREEKSATYVAKAGWVNWSDVYPGHCYVTAMAEIANNEAGRYSKMILKIAQELAENGPQQEELERVKAQVIAENELVRTRNDYWVNTVFSGAERGDWRLDLARDYKGFVEKTTLDDVAALAKKVLNNKAVYRCEAIPKMPSDSK